LRGVDGQERGAFHVDTPGEVHQQRNLLAGTVFAALPKAMGKVSCRESAFGVVGIPMMMMMMMMMVVMMMMLRMMTPPSPACAW
jgi:hypothetical protein